MFILNDDNSIYLTRGDVLAFAVAADGTRINADTEERSPFKFQAGDVLTMKVYAKKDCTDVVLSKDFPVLNTAEQFWIYLTEEDTKIDDIINKPKDYWYEIVLNEKTNPQTIIGYDDDGVKLFRLFPEGADIPETPVKPEDIPVVDTKLDMTSNRPVENRAIARAFENLREGYEAVFAAVEEKFVTPEMFGAIGDGVADDTEAIQSAIDSGSPVTLQHKTYYIGKPLYMKNSNIAFNAENATIEYGGTDYAIIFTNVHYKTVRFGDINAPNGGCVLFLSENGSNCVSYIDLYFSRLTANAECSCIKASAESENSYINEIRIYNGRLKKGKYGVEVVNNTNHLSACRINNWKFYNVGLEGVETGVYLNAATNRIERFVFVGLRYAVNEGTTCFLKTTGKCYFLTWLGSDKILYDTDNYFKLSSETARSYFYGNAFNKEGYVGHLVVFEYGEWYLNGQDSLMTFKQYTASSNWDNIKKHGVYAFNTWTGEGGNGIFPVYAKGFLIVYENEGDFTHYCVSPTAIGSRNFSGSSATWGEWKVFSQEKIEELTEKANVVKVVQGKESVTFNIDANASIIYSTFEQSGIVSVRSDLSDAPTTEVIAGEKPTITYNASAKTVTMTFPAYRTITFITKYTIAD